MPMNGQGMTSYLASLAGCARGDSQDADSGSPFPKGVFVVFEFITTKPPLASPKCPPGCSIRQWDVSKSNPTLIPVNFPVVSNVKGPELCIVHPSDFDVEADKGRCKSLATHWFRRTMVSVVKITLMLTTLSMLPTTMLTVVPNPPSQSSWPTNAA